MYRKRSSEINDELRSREARQRRVIRGQVLPRRRWKLEGMPFYIEKPGGEPPGVTNPWGIGEE